MLFGHEGSWYDGLVARRCDALVPNLQHAALFELILTVVLHVLLCLLRHLLELDVFDALLCAHGRLHLTCLLKALVLKAVLGLNLWNVLLDVRGESLQLAKYVLERRRDVLCAISYGQLLLRC